MNETFYRRNEQGEYIPVSYYESNILDAVKIGSAMLYTVQKNGFVRRECVEPDFVALQAAAQHLQDRIASILYHAMSAKPKKTTLTQYQQDLLDQLIASGIRDFWFPSMGEAADNVLKEIVDAAKPAVQVPWVKEAAEQYRAALALTMKEKS